MYLNGDVTLMCEEPKVRHLELHMMRFVRVKKS